MTCVDGGHGGHGGRAPRAFREKDAGPRACTWALVAPPSWSRAITAASLLLGLLSPSAALAQPNEAIAEALFRAAQEKMAAHDLDAACDLFARSQKIDPALGTLLNLATCHEKQGKTATAWTEFSEAYAGARHAGDEQRSAFARAHLAVLEKRLPRVVVEVMTPAPGLRVSLDGAELPREAWGTPLPLDPGDHRIDALAPDRDPFVRTIRLGPSGGTDRIEVTLLLAATAAAPETSLVPPAPAPAPPAVKPGPDGRWIGGWIAVGLGVAGLGVAIGLGADMASNVNRRDQLCPPGTPCAIGDAFSADHAARIDRVGLFVSGGIGLAVLGTGVGLLIVSRNEKTLSSVSVEVTPMVGAARSGIGVRGTF